MVKGSKKRAGASSKRDQIAKGQELIANCYFKVCCQREGVSTVNVNHPLAAIHKEKEMKKLMTVFFSLGAIMLMAMPAYAQGGSAAAPATNWVPIASGFGIRSGERNEETDDGIFFAGSHNAYGHASVRAGRKRRCSGDQLGPHSLRVRHPIWRKK